MRKLVLLFGILFLFSFASAQIQVNEKINFLKQFEGEELPGIAGASFGNERMNLYVESGEEIIVISLITENKKFASVTEGELTNPTLLIYTDETTLKEIENSEEPLGAFESAINDGKITYTGVGFGKKIKFAFMKILAKIVGWFR